jgi:HEPN domain-containing protein
MRDITKSWVEFAIRDLKAAEELLGDDFLANIVLFHSQQSVEKLTKALLEEYLLSIPRVHSIKTLSFKLPDEIRESIFSNGDEINLLDDIYINERYPSELGILPDGFPSSERAKKIFYISKNLCDKILNHLGYIQ